MTQRQQFQEPTFIATTLAVCLLAIVPAISRAAPPDDTENPAIIVNPGTPGAALPGESSVTQHPGNHMMLAILGALAPADDHTPTRIAAAVQAINLLHPRAVFCVGNLLPPTADTSTQWNAQAKHLRTAFHDLQMPWFPCVGGLGGAAQDPAHRKTWTTWYAKAMGPRYYSVDIAAGPHPNTGSGGVHVIVLDSEEPLPSHGLAAPAAGISPTQLRWLKSDLDALFDRVVGGTADPDSAATTANDAQTSVIVLLHRALWRPTNRAAAPPGAAEQSWNAAHALLLDFNRRPIVSVEGMGQSSRIRRAPRVVAVFAGAGISATDDGYSQEPTRDGIHYIVLGPTAAAVPFGRDDIQRRYLTLVTLGAPPDARTHPDSPRPAELQQALLAMDGGKPTGADTWQGPLLPGGIVTSPEREAMAAIAALDQTRPDPFQIDGTLRATGGELRLHLSNPLKLTLRASVTLDADSAKFWTLTPPAQPTIPLPPETNQPLSLQLSPREPLPPNAAPAPPATIPATRPAPPPPVLLITLIWRDPAHAASPSAPQEKRIRFRRPVPIAPPQPATTQSQ